MLTQLMPICRRTALSLVLLFCVSLSQAQVSVEFGAVNEYMFNTRQALNLVIVNSNPKSFPVYIKGRISDAGGQPVVEFRSSELMLNTGSNLISPMSASLEELNYSNQDIAEIENRTGTYPSGNYTICVWLACVTQDCNGAGSGAAGMEQVKCMPVHIENPTPLILATPGNESEIEETRPLFTWIPPSPVAGSSSLNYTMILVEMMEGQTKADALNMNRPLIQMEGIGQPSLMFPPDLPALEPGKTYAWQVEAFVGKTSIAKSEQWKFKVKKEEKKPVVKQAVFLKAKKDPYIHEIKDDSLFIGLKNVSLTAIQQGSIVIMVKDHAGKIIQQLTLNIVQDKDHIGYQLVKLASLQLVPEQKSGMYILEIPAIKGEERFLRIRIL